MKGYKVLRADMRSVWCKPGDYGIFANLPPSDFKWQLGIENKSGDGGFNNKLYACPTIKSAMYWARCAIEEYRNELPKLKIFEVECNDVSNYNEVHIVCKSITLIKEVKIKQLELMTGTFREQHNTLTILMETL